MTIMTPTLNTIWACAKAGKSKEVAQYLRTDPTLLHATDNHGNTPLYYAALGGHMSLVRNLSKLGARDDTYGRCYLNSLNLEIRRVLATFNNYNKNVQTQKLMSHSFQTEEVTLKQAITQLYKKIPLPDSEQLVDRIEDDDCSDVTLVLRNKDRVLRYKCHLFVLLCRWDEFTNILLSQAGISINSSNIATKRLAIHTFLRGKREIDIKDMDQNVFEVILQWIYTGKIQSDKLLETRSEDYKKELLFCNIHKQTVYRKVNIPVIIKLLEATKELPLVKLYDTIVAALKQQKVEVEDHVKLPKPKVLRNKKGKKVPKQPDPPQPGILERRDMIREYKTQELNTFKASFSKCIFSDKKPTSPLSTTRLVLREICDVKLAAIDNTTGEEQYIYCPRLLLQIRSDYFMLMLGGDSFADMISFQDELKMRNVTIDQAVERADMNFFSKEADAPKCEIHDCNIQSLQATVKYMASDNIIVPEDALDAIFLSMRFGLIGMKKTMMSQISDDLNEENALVFFTLASDTDAFSNLRADALAIIMRTLRRLFTGPTRIQDSENYLLEQGASDEILVHILEKLY